MTKRQLPIGAAHLDSMRKRLAVEVLANGYGETGEPVSELATAAAHAGSIDWAAMDGDTAMASVLQLETARRAVDSAVADGMAHLDRCGATLAEHGLSAPAWLSHHSRGSRVEAKRTVELGRTLTLFTRFADAIRTGRLSTDHARALAAVSNPRIADLLVQAEETLLEMALETTFSAFRRNLRVIANQLDEDGAKPDCSDRDELRVSTDGEGGLHLRGRLSGHQAIAVERALREEYDRQWRSAHSEYGHTGATIPTPAVLRARALVEIVRRGLASDPTTSSKPRTEALIVIESGEARTDDGEPLDEATAAVLACDAFLQPLVMDPVSNTPLFVGRASRNATREQRRALMVRDGGCVFPGCDAPPSWCDVHHIVPWEDGGTTDIDNLALLCRRHHGFAHSRDWLLEAIAPLDSDDGSPAPDGTIRLVWHTPRGVVDAQRQCHRRRRTAA